MPAVSLAQYLLGKNMRSLEVDGDNVSSTGNVTFSGGTDICSADGIATFEQVEFNTDAILEMVKPADQLWNNNLIIGYDYDIAVREIIPDNGVGALMDIVQNNTHGKVVACYGRLGAAGAIYIATYGVWGPMRFPIMNGRNVAEASLKPVGFGLYIGTSAPTAF